MTEAIDQIRQTIERADCEAKAREQIDRLRKRLALGRALDARDGDPAITFWGHILLRLEMIPDWSIETAATDGRAIRYNPVWIASKPLEEVAGVLVHEAGHVAQRHHTRRGQRQMTAWNIATDLELHGGMLSGVRGMKLPSEGVFPGKGPFKDLPPGEAAEWYYDRLPENSGDGADDPGQCGGVQDPKKKPGESQQDANDRADAESRAEVAAAESAAKKRGELPDHLARMVGSAIRPPVPWQDILRQFLRSFTRSDYSWNMPSRRGIAQDVHLPGLRSESLGEIIIGMDTSGSVDDEQRNIFQGACEDILSAYDCTAHIVWCDAEIHETREWTPADGPLDLSGPGGGGTDHRPIWKWVESQGIEPSCCICLTDLYTQHGDEPPYPVLWVSTGADEAPWGQVVKIKA